MGKSVVFTRGYFSFSTVGQQIAANYFRALFRSSVEAFSQRWGLGHGDQREETWQGGANKNGDGLKSPFSIQLYCTCRKATQAAGLKTLATSYWGQIR